jgi:hypothetical protein
MVFVTPTIVQWWAVVRIEDYGWKESNVKLSSSLAGAQRRNERWLERFVESLVLPPNWNLRFCLD